MTHPKLATAMMKPAFYPECPRSVELVQTHISYVFIAGDFVYKIKKPVIISEKIQRKKTVPYRTMAADKGFVSGMPNFDRRNVFILTAKLLNMHRSRPPPMILDD